MQKEKGMTVGGWTEQWFIQRVGQWNLHTESGYRNLIFNHIIPGVGRAQLTELTTRRIQSFYKRLVQNGLSARSVWCVHLLLRRCLDEACRDGQIPLNPARICAVPQTKEHQTIPLRLGQLQRYLNAAEKLGALPIIYIGLTSGLRQCELLTLSWADFHVSSQYILKGKRLLALNDKAAALMEDLPPSGLPLVFLNTKTGEAYRLHEFYYLHKKILEEARLPWIAFRDLQRQCMEVEI
ncbi:Integrase family protein [uncultured Eubacteriales bacterium]|uniref:Integrase family protein n=1 Tax=uncultured Eubacteriales bacterium TaxID=172733 RepID=A0A212K308_9FIRM|nr:Integrase family protein [uncultured Eubacteriales bacterium]